MTMRWRLWLGAAAAVVAVSSGLRAATTNTYYVNVSNSSPSSPFGDWTSAATNIQDAVDRANADYTAGNVFVVLVTGGHYRLTQTVAMTNNPITLRNAAARDSTLIDGQGTVRCLDVNNATSIVDGFTITNGYTASTAEAGAGVRVTRGTVMNCRIAGNYALYSGGGAYLGTTAALLTNCLIIGNTGGQGGGVNMGQGLIKHCTIMNNTAPNYFQRGGAVRMANGIVDGCLMTGNKGGEGGAVRIYNGYVYNCVITGNVASYSPYNGGGVYMDNGRLHSCTLTDNSATRGGGAYVTSSGSRVKNCIVYYNTAVESNDVYFTGGRFDNSCSLPMIPDGANSASNTDLAPQFVNRTAGNLNLMAGSPCIDTGTPVDAYPYDYAGRVRPLDGDDSGTAQYDMGAFEAESPSAGPLSCNFVGAPTAGFYPLAVTFAAFPGGNTNGILYFWSFGDGVTLGWTTNAAPTHTYGAGLFGVTLAVTNAGGESATLTKPDYVLAAAETIYVSPTGSHVPPFDTWPTAATNIQTAIDAALDTPSLHSEVIVGDGLYGLTNALSLAKGIAVRSQNGAAAAIIDGGYPARTNRCLSITASGALFDGFTVSNGYSTASGGGIYMLGGTVRNCTIVANVTEASGGGISMGSGTAVSNCLVLGNRVTGAGNGGGVYMAGLGTLKGCMLKANRVVSSGYGGGVSTGAGSLVDECSIVANTNNYRGGGVSCSYGTLRNCDIAENRAAEGGGLFSDYGVIDRCGLSNNVATSSGGGGFLRTQTLMRNCLVAGNEGPSAGGLRLTHDHMVVENCTVAGNRATTAALGGGVYQDKGYVTNTIVYFNQAAGVANDVTGTVVSFSFSCAPELGDDPVRGNRAADPLFVRNGVGVGLALVHGDYRPGVLSPCRDVGTNLGWMATATDLAGKDRVLVRGSRRPIVDMGAYEGQPPEFPGVLLKID